MGTQGSGRKRIANRERLSAEDDTLNLIAREAEARLAAKRAARAEAREIRMKELERQQKEVSDEDDWTSVASRSSTRVEERLEKDFIEKGSRAASSLSAATFASLGGTSSRRGSGETTTSIDTEGSIREIKDSLMEVEEKYKKAMVSNAQLDNEKANLMYQVDTLREDLLELEEQLAEVHRGHKETTKELERQKHAYSILQHLFEEMKETLKEREEMLTAHGLLTNGEAEHIGKEGSSLRETAHTRPQTEVQRQSSNDGPLGESCGLQMRNDILKAVEQRGDVQNTATDEQMEDTGNREMLMDNVEEKGKIENCEELTEIDTPTVTVRDNGNTDQLGCSSSNLNDGEQSAFGTQNTGFKEVHERTISSPGAEERMQTHGCREGSESENDPEVQGNQLQEKTNHTLNDEEKLQNEQVDSGLHRNLINEIHTEVGNDLDAVHNDSVGTAADHQMIVEKTQQIVQNVVEKAVQILQQEMFGHELQGKSQDRKETICVEIGSVEVKGENLTRTQERFDESQQVKEKELDGVIIQKTEHEQAITKDNELHSAAQGSEIISISLQGDEIKNEEVRQLLIIPSDQNDQHRPGREGINEMDGAEKGGESDQDRKKHTLSEELEEVEEMADKVKVGNDLIAGAALQELEEIKEVSCHLRGERGPVMRDEVINAVIQHRPGRKGINEMDGAEKGGESDQDRNKHTVSEELDQVEEMADKVKLGNDLIAGTALQELEEIKEVACRLRGERGPVMRDEVKNAVIHHEDQDEAEPNLTAKPGDGAGQLLQQQNVEGSFEHECLQKITLNEGKKETETETENNTLEFEDEVRRLKENEVKARERKECKEEHKGLSEGEVKGHGSNESEKDIKKSDSEGHGIDEGTDKETGRGRISHDGESWEIGKFNGVQSERAVKGAKAYMNKGNSWDEDQAKEENDNINYPYETKSSNEDIIKNQEECEAKWETQGEKIEMQVSEDISSEFKEDENKFQHHSPNRFRGTGEGDEIKGLKEENDEVRDEEECEIKSKGKEGEEVKWSKYVEGDEMESLTEEDIEDIGTKGDEVKSPREVEEDEVKNTRELDDGVKGVEGDEVQSSRFNDEDGVRSPKDDKKAEEHQVKSPREDDNEVTDNEENEVRGPRGEVKVKNEEVDEIICSREEDGVRDEKEDQVKNIREEFIEVKSDEGDELNSPRLELQDYARNSINEEIRIKSTRGEENVIEKGNVVIGSNIVDVKGPMEEIDEDKDPIEESGKVRNKEGDMIMGPKDEDAGEAKGPIEADVKSIAEDGYEVKGLRTENGEEVKSCREEEDDVKSPRGEEKHECEGTRDKENKIKSDQNSEEQHGTVTLGRAQGKENEICVIEESNEAKLTDLLSEKEILGGIMAEEIECHLKEQVNESYKTDELQEKNFEEICEGTSKSGEKENMMLDISSRNKTFGDNAHILEEVVNSTEEKDEGARFELNEGQEQLAQDSVMDTAAIEDFDNQRNQESKEVDSVKGERDASGTNKEQMIQGSETNKTTIEDTTNIQRNIEEQKIRDKYDPEEGNHFGGEEMNDKLQDKIRDDKEVPTCEEKRGKASTESETEAKCLMKVESSENLTPSIDCNRGAANDEQEYQPRNSSSRWSNIHGGQEEGESQKDMSSISGAEGNMKEADEEMRRPETAKDSKRKSKSKDDCLLS